MKIRIELIEEPAEEEIVIRCHSPSKSSFSTTSEAAFAGTHKKVFVSRFYMKLLKEKLMEMRMR